MTENRPLTSLRGFAAVWVIFSHITPEFAAQWHGASWRALRDGSWRALRDGYMGVDVFFVLSGFILGVVYQDLRPAQTPGFFLKRILRLYPLNIAILIVMAALSWTIMPLGSWTDPAQLPLFVLMLEGFKSWPVPAWNPVTWSVGVELACYACFPLAMFGLRRLPAALILALSLILLAGSVWAQGFCLGWPVGWHGVVRGMSSFWPGVALGTLALRWPKCPARWASAGELLCVACLAAAIATDHLRLVPLITAALVLLLFSDAGIVARELRRSWIFWLGEISFSIYLLFGLLLSRLTWVESWLSGRLPSWLALALFVAFYLAVTFALAHVTYVTIERPFRNLARPGSRGKSGGGSPRPAIQSGTQSLGNHAVHSGAEAGVPTISLGVQRRQ